MSILQFLCNANQAVTKDIPIRLKCLLCNDLMVHPIHLPHCHHDFCQVCLYRYFSLALKKICPECYRLNGVMNTITLVPFTQAADKTIQKDIDRYCPYESLQRISVHQEWKQKEWLPIMRLWDVKQHVLLVPIQIPTRLRFEHPSDCDFLQEMATMNKDQSPIHLVIPCGKNVLGLYISITDIVVKKVYCLIPGMRKVMPDVVDCTITCHYRVQILDQWKLYKSDLCLSIFYQDQKLDGKTDAHNNNNNMQEAVTLLNEICTQTPNFFLHRKHLFKQYAPPYDDYALSFPLNPEHFCWWALSLLFDFLPIEIIHDLFLSKKLSERYTLLLQCLRANQTLQILN